MNNQEILDNAPEGATHVMGGNCYCMENTEDDYSEDGYDYLTFRNEDTSGRHRSLEDIKRITELEKELATSTPPPNLVWFERSDVLGLDPQQTGVIDLRKFALKQQAKGLTDYAKEQEQGLNAVWMIAAASKLINQAKALKGQKE